MLARSRHLHRIGCATLVGIIMALWSITALADGHIVFVSRERVLREAEAAKHLLEAQESMAAQLQASVDAAEAQLAAEESELTKLRTELSPEVFEARAEDFDRRVRAVRRETQERAAFVKRGFQDASAVIVEALPEFIEQVREEVAAAAVLNLDQALATAPGLDMTDRVIQLYDESGPTTLIPKIDLSRPLLEKQPEVGDGSSNSDQ